MGQISLKVTQLVKKAKRKDQRSIEALYSMFYPKMKGVCMKIIKTDEDITHDIVQNAFIQALASLDSLSNEERFGEWLTTITRNLSLKYIEKKNKLRFVPLSELSAGDVRFASSLDNPESLVSLKEIEVLIQQLPKGYGEVFWLSVIEGYTHAEIGEMLGIAPHSSSSQLARAKALLRKLLRDKQQLFFILLLLVAMPCTVLLLYQEKNDEKELVKHHPKTKKQHHATSSVPSDSIKETAQRPEPLLAKGATQRVVASYADSISNRVEPVVDSTAVAMSSNAEVQDSVAIKIDSLMHEHTQREVYIAQTVPSKSRKSEWQLTANATINFEAERNNNMTFAFTDDMPEPDISSGEVPQNITTWEQYAQQLSMDVFENPTEENQALFDVAQHNSGKIIEQEHHSNPVSVGIALSKTINTNLSLETGVQYDRLESRFRMGSASSNVLELQRIDYLGIPFRTTYRLYNHKHFNIYGTLGVMLHVPLKGSSSNNYMVEGQNIYHFETSVNAPLQWTLPLGFGVQYQFTKNISIYVQPTLNRHLPSSSNVRTMWTEHPWQLTVPAGIRIAW